MDIVNIVMRFVHIFSAIALLGGALVWAFAPKEDDIARWKGIALSSVVGLLVSGTWNFLHKVNLPREYHMIFGFKVLLALHVFAVTLLATRPSNPKRQRLLKGAVVSGVAIVLMSAVLRAITQR